MQFFDRNISFKNPTKVDIVIFDECNSEYVKRVLNSKYRIRVLKMRPFELLVSYSIIQNFIKGLRKVNLKYASSYSRGFVYGLAFQMRAVYFEACLIAMSPKAVITMIDNSNSFHWLSKNSRIFPYIAIQNGNRLSFELVEHDEYYLQHFFSWGTDESKIYNALGYKVENFYPVGSLIGSLYFDNTFSNKNHIQYDILIVSTWRGNIGYPVNVVDTMKSMRIMDEILAKYLRENSIKAAIILRSERCSEHWVMQGIGNEYDYYRSVYGESINIIEANFTDRTVYPTMQQSRLIISCLSSALKEAYGIGKKVLYFNYTGKKEYHCDLDSKCVIEENDYLKVVQVIDQLLNQPDDEYRAIHLENINAVMCYPDGASTCDVIQSTIDEIIDRHAPQIMT